MPLITASGLYTADFYGQNPREILKFTPIHRVNFREMAFRLLLFQLFKIFKYKMRHPVEKILKLYISTFQQDSSK